MARTDTKVKKPGLNKYSPLLLDHKMVLRAQELAPSGIMLVILSLNASIYKQSFQILAPKKGLVKTLKFYLKVKNPPVTYLCSLFCTLKCTIIVPKAQR